MGEENIHLKSIVREMFEEFRSFADYIKLYELQRAEGVLLRHLNSVFKVLAQTVPDTAKNDQLREMEIYLGTMIRQVDSSLLDEWEKMRDPNYQRAETKEVRPPGAEEAAADITRDVKNFTAAIRNRIFIFLRGLVVEDYEAAIAGLDSPLDADGTPWTADRLQQNHGRLSRPTTSGSAWIRTPAMRATPTSRRPTTRNPGACSKCSWTRRSTTTGWRNSKWTWANPGNWADRSCACGGWEV